MPVIDASVFVALVHEGDRYHQQSLRWYESSLRAGVHLAAPSLLVVEVAAAIRRLTGSESLAERVISELVGAGDVEFFPLTSKRSATAARVAIETGVRGADAVYLGLARELGESLVTLDRQQLQRGASVVRVERPSSESWEHDT